MYRVWSTVIYEYLLPLLTLREHVFSKYVHIRRSSPIVQAAAQYAPGVFQDAMLDP